MPKFAAFGALFASPPTIHPMDVVHPVMEKILPPRAGQGVVEDSISKADIEVGGNTRGVNLQTIPEM